MHSEYDLLRQIALGDEAAFTTLFNNYKNKIYSIAFELTHSSAVAEEIVQDVFLKIWVKRQALDEVRHFQAYLFTITRNTVFTALKRLAREQRLASFAGDASTAENADHHLLSKEYRAVLKEAIERLPEKQRQVYVLIRDKGYKRDEVAAELGVSPETVKTHLAQAMRSIRAYCLSRIELSIALILLTRIH